MNLRTPWALAAGVIVLAICLQSETIQRVVRTANFSTSTAARGAMQLFRFAFAKSGMTNKSSYTPDMGSFFDLKANGIDGKEVDFKQYAGNVVLVINVASKCGYTDSGYKQLVEWYEKYKDRGFTIFGFPCNQFLGQEPAQECEIKQFCENKYKVRFPMFAKVDVNGPNTHPVWQWLKRAFPGDVPWNFQTRFLINRQGVPVWRFDKVNYKQMEPIIEQLLAEPVPGSSSSDSKAEGGN